MRDKKKYFLKSALTETNPFISTQGVLEWLKRRNSEVKVNIQKIDFAQMDKWNICADKGNLSHESGGFFSIDGIHVKTNWGNVPEWNQPIINQPEIGFLGIITKEIDGILYFLMQAKIEPGNVNYVQLSPTLQATKSNYSQLHKGKKPRYLEYFLDRKNNAILLDQLQSEQGARFLRKRNRNIIIKVESDIEIHEDFCWLTLGQIKKLMRVNNIVNMDTRTVISGIPFPDFSDDIVELRDSLIKTKDDTDSFKIGQMVSMLDSNSSYLEFDDLLSWLTQQKSTYDLSVKQVSILKLKDWTVSESHVHHSSGKFFTVIGVNVEISNREVMSWSQPLIAPAQEGLCAFITKRINGVYHYLVQSKLECGNLDVLELAPTIQCLTGNYRQNRKSLPYLEYVLNATSNQIRYDTLQSEEGGRFYREQNRNMLIEAKDDFPLDTPANYNWMTLNQLLTFLKFNNYLNIQARSLISAVSFI